MATPTVTTVPRAHYRFSTEVGAAMGRRIGELAVAKHLQAPAFSTISDRSLGVN